MKSHHLSILPDNSVADLTTDADAASAEGNSANYYARYQAFLNQQSQRSQRRVRPNSLIRFLQGAINFAIFVALFLAILTLFGFGLSLLNGNVKVAKGDVSATGKQAATVAEMSLSPATSKKSTHNK